MTITQLEYIVAVDQHRNFRRAAEACFVTQPTLSAQVQKLEEELEVTLFDRSKSPVTPTRMGQQIVKQARAALSEAQRVLEIVSDEKGLIQGSLSVAVIPTIVPYLLPRFLKALNQKYPDLHLKIFELTTENALKALAEETVDVAIIATREDRHKYTQEKLYDEDMLLYLHPSHPLHKKKRVTVDDLHADEMWLLEEGHCLRDEIVKVCHLQRQMNSRPQNLDLKVGSLETLRFLVEDNFGYTLLPYLATLHLNKKQKTMLRPLSSPRPSRPIYLTCRRKYLKKAAIEVLKNEIVQSLPNEVLKQ